MAVPTPLTRPPRAPRPWALGLALLGVLALGACSSSKSSRTGNIPVEDIDRLTFTPDDTSIGMFLAECDRAITSWSSLTLTAQTQDEKRRARQLQQVLRHQTRQRQAELITELATGPSFNRVRAAAALGFTDSAEALSPLLASLSDPNPDVVHNGLLGLAILERPETPLAPICQVLSDSSDPQSRSNAAYAIRSVLQRGGSGDCALTTSRVGLIDDEPFVRMQCALILGLLADTDSIEALSDMIYDEHPPVSQAAVEALVLIAEGEESHKGEVARALVTVYAKNDKALRSRARRAMVSLAKIDYGNDLEPWQEWAGRLP